MGCVFAQLKKMLYFCAEMRKCGRTHYLYDNKQEQNAQTERTGKHL